MKSRKIETLNKDVTNVNDSSEVKMKRLERTIDRISSDNKSYKNQAHKTGKIFKELANENKVTQHQLNRVRALKAGAKAEARKLRMSKACLMDSMQKIKKNIEIITEENDILQFESHL